MKKEEIVNVCKKVYNYLVEKGCNATLVKLLIGALFGIACAYLLNSCSMAYTNGDIQYKGSILQPVEYNK